MVNHALTERDKVILNLLWYSGMRLSEVADVKAKDFNWQEGTVIVLGKSNRYRMALAGNGIVKDWFTKHDSLVRFNHRWNTNHATKARTSYRYTL